MVGVCRLAVSVSEKSPLALMEPEVGLILDTHVKGCVICEHTNTLQTMGVILVEHSDVD